MKVGDRVECVLNPQITGVIEAHMGSHQINVLLDEAIRVGYGEQGWESRHTRWHDWQLRVIPPPEPKTWFVLQKNKRTGDIRATACDIGVHWEQAKMMVDQWNIGYDDWEYRAFDWESGLR